MSSDLNSILKVYLGTDSRGGYQPIGIDQRMKQAFPKDHDAKMALIAKYLEAEHPPADWEKTGLAEEAKVFAEKLANRFPELDAVAARALANRWSFGWK